MKVEKYRLNKIADILAGGTPSTKNEEYWNGDIPWLSVKDFGNTNKWVSETEKKITELGFNNCPSSMLNKGDLILSARGTVGKVAMVDKDMAFNQSCFGLRANKTIITQDYLFYWFENNQQIFKSAQQGNVFKSVTLDFFDKTEAVIPSVSEQQKIAAVLSSLDDKIALNSRINAKLEQMAKHLYDHWFVQFDFHNADGKPYKANGGKMVWNETLKREIPDGWEVKKLGDVCEIVLGGTPSTANNEFWDNGTISWLNSGEVGIFPIVESEKKITEIAVEKSTTEFLKAGSVTLSITRYLRPSILAIDACINQSVVGIKENDLFKNCFLYPYLQNEIDRLMSLRTGAQQPHINKEIVEDSFINIPPKELMEKYEKKVTPIYLQIINIAKEIQKLTMLRDRLLPLLMNGQVEVK